jgi:hypothetical protein
MKIDCKTRALRNLHAERIYDITVTYLIPTFTGYIYPCIRLFLKGPLTRFTLNPSKYGLKDALRRYARYGKIFLKGFLDLLT